MILDALDQQIYARFIFGCAIVLGATEFSRLFGRCSSEILRLDLAIEAEPELRHSLLCIVVISPTLDACK